MGKPGCLGGGGGDIREPGSGPNAWVEEDDEKQEEPEGEAVGRGHQRVQDLIGSVDAVVAGSPSSWVSFYTRKC